VEIRALVVECLQELRRTAPGVFRDFELHAVRGDDAAAAGLGVAGHVSLDVSRLIAPPPDASLSVTHRASRSASALDAARLPGHGSLGSQPSAAQIMPRSRLSWSSLKSRDFTAMWDMPASSPRRCSISPPSSATIATASLPSTFSAASTATTGR
jgi:hypothetical protein